VNTIRASIKKKIISIIIENQTLSRLFRYALADKGVLFFRDFDDHALVYYPHDIIGIMLTETGEYQRGPVRLIAEIFERNTHALNGSWILELGGNIGTHTVYFCKAFEHVKVLTVEADPENAEVLRRNVQLNKLDNRVEVICGAVSNYDGQIDLVRDYYNRGGASVGGNRSMDRGSIFSTQCIKVDTLLRQNGIDQDKIGLIWIDVEGHELEVFEGMDYLISKVKPPVFFEFNRRKNVRRSRLLDIVFENYTSVSISRGGRFDKMTRDDFEDITENVDVFATND
jgi:FkbM family methyltransferase